MEGGIHYYPENLENYSVVEGAWYTELTSIVTGCGSEVGVAVVVGSGRGGRTILRQRAGALCTLQMLLQ